RARLEQGERTRDLLLEVAINPIWLKHSEQDAATWIDINVTNALSSAVAKAMYVRLAVAAAEMNLDAYRAMPVPLWAEQIGLRLNPKPNRTAAQFSEPIAQLKAAGVIV